jgi:hypothetical protein
MRSAERWRARTAERRLEVTSGAMDTHNPPLFSPTALSILDRMPFDPDARASYELLSGALMWPDECPRPGTPEFAAVAPVGAYRYLVAYRASITLGGERTKFRPVWEQVVQYAPNWPGLCPERRGERARRRLLAAQRQQARCLDELERHLRGGTGRHSLNPLWPPARSSN